MNELALFAGAGGGLLGTRLLGFRPVCAVELDPYRREILLRRQEEGHLDPFPVWDDIRTFDGVTWHTSVDIVTAGFPCQPFSVAGKQQGEHDPRNMWPDTIRVIREVRPRFCLLENVPGLKAKEYFGTILADLASYGYYVRWDCVRASDCGAPHRRDRLWILADASPIPIWGQPRRRGRQEGEDQTQFGLDGEDRDVAHPKSERLEGTSRQWVSGERRTSVESADGCEDVAHPKPERRRSETEGWLQPNRKKAGREEAPNRAGECCADVGNAHQEGQPQQEGTEQDLGRRPTNSSWWASEPDVGRVANGVAHRVDRLGALGDGQVPAVVVRAWKILTGRQHAV